LPIDQAESLKITIAEVREEARKERVHHGRLQFVFEKRERKIGEIEGLIEQERQRRVQLETELDSGNSLITSQKEAAIRSRSNYGELEQDLDASKKVVASLQQELKNAEARVDSLQRSLDEADRDVCVLKAGFEIKGDLLELQEHLMDTAAGPIRRRDINFSFRKEDQHSKEAVKGGNRAAHDPNFVADAILWYFGCLTDRDIDIAMQIYGEALEVHATSINDLNRLMRRTRFVGWLNTRARLHSWMKEKKHNGTSKRAEIFRQLDKQLLDLKLSIGNLDWEDDEIHKAFEEDPRVEATLAELRKIAVTEERTRKPPH
jgi:hypothetical protein